ncbi:MAG: beta-propeller fold lactonase family protein [Acidobacteria bacterium]|nr:beta-propeller fold lactonase family protein [Acidobacteriota bacterium]
MAGRSAPRAPDSPDNRPRRSPPAGCLQPAERGQCPSPAARRHPRDGGGTAAHLRYRHLRPSRPRPPVQPRGRPRDARERADGRHAGRSGRARGVAYADGKLTDRASISPNGGYGFQARHIDFHPTRPWAYLTLEHQNQIAVFGIADGSLSPAPLFVKTTLAEPEHVRPGQTTSSIHVHPNGRFVYVGNRASATVPSEGARVSAGGKNTLAVFAIDQTTGEPASLATFRIGADGRLTFVRTYTRTTEPVGTPEEVVPRHAFHAPGDGRGGVRGQADGRAGPEHELIGHGVHVGQVRVTEEVAAGGGARVAWIRQPRARGKRRKPPHGAVSLHVEDDAPAAVARMY